MIEAGEVLQEVQDAAAATAFKIPPRPCSRPFDVDDKAAAGAIAPFAPVTLGGLAQEAKCRLPQELGPVGVRGSVERLGWGSPGGTDLTRPSSVYTSLGESPAP